MGITYHEFKFLEHFSNNNTFGNVLTLGRQEIILNNQDKIRLNIQELDCAKEGYIDTLLKYKFNAQSVKSIDNSSFEDADLIHDLNKPLNQNSKKYDTILDFGTSEHVFNIFQCLKNISDLCKLGGNILHSLPANNNCGHGFWQFSPELFFSMYSEKNGFSDTEVFIFNTHDKYAWWKVNKQAIGERLEISSDTPLYILVKTRKTSEINELVVQQSDYVERWDQKEIKIKNKKNNLSIFWKLTKDKFKDFLFNFILPIRISEKLVGKKLLNKNNLKNNKNLIKINF